MLCTGGLDCEFCSHTPRAFSCAAGAVSRRPVPTAFLGAVGTPDVLSLLLQEITESARTLCNDIGKEGSLSFQSSHRVLTLLGPFSVSENLEASHILFLGPPCSLCGPIRPVKLDQLFSSQPASLLQEDCRIKRSSHLKRGLCPHLRIESICNFCSIFHAVMFPLVIFWVLSTMLYS